MTEENKPVLRDAKGHFIAGTGTYSGVGRPKSGHYLSRLIKVEFQREMEVELDGELTKLERRVIMADALAQLISTGQVRLPDRRDKDNRLIPGKVFNYNGTEWMKHVLRVLRYVEPPVVELEVQGDVEGIIFDKEIEQIMLDKEEVIDSEQQRI
jgi:hypothetical protein